MKLSHNKQKGFSLLEMVFYIAIFAVFSLVIIDTMILMTKSFRESQIQSDLVQSSQIMERITREIRKGNAVSSISSNTLVLGLEDDPSTAVSDSSQFVLSGTDLLFSQNGTLVGNLNSANILINNISFTQINTAKSVAVKVILSVSSAKDTQNRIYDFYGTAVLRGSY